MMQSIWVKKKQTCGLVFVIVVSYLLLRPRNYEHAAAVVIPKIHPSDAWEFVADFSNMKYLNPTIVDFNILTESGNYEHWRYSTQYEENLSHWPYLSNVAIAHFDVKALPRQDVFYVLSSHNTCLFWGLFCLKSTSEFKFSRSGPKDGALCEEQVQYECPLLMAKFCEREVEYQRSAIMKNLKTHFTHKTST